MRLNKSQLFIAFALFWIGLGWLGTILAIAGFFYTQILFAYVFIGIVALLFLFFINLDLVKKISRTFLLICILIILIIALFSIFSEPTIFSGRDQGSLSEAAIRLSQNHQLKFSFPAEKEFFQIYGPGKALNFPGFNYTHDGQLITQFPLGYIAWLAIFYSFFGLSGLIVANAVVLFLFALAFYFLLRFYLKPLQATIGLLLFLTSFVSFWFFKFTLSENLALALVWLGIFSFVLFLQEKKCFYFLSSLLIFGLMAFTRIEALAFLFMAFLILFFTARKQKQKLADFVGKKVIWMLIGIIFVFLAYVVVDSQFFITLIKGAIKPFSGTTENSVLPANLLVSFYYTLRVLSTYYLLNFILFGIVGLIWVLKEKKEIAIPFLIILPAFIYLFYPNISPDHPWMLRRFMFTLVPFGVFYSTLLFAFFFKNKMYLFYIFSGLLLLPNLLLFARYFPIVPHQKLLSEIDAIARDFSNEDLLLIDNETTGDGWSMISGPLNFIYNKQCAYFFNVNDLEKINLDKFNKVYFLIPDNHADHYIKGGLLEKMDLVKNYIFYNNFLESDAINESISMRSPVSLPNEKVVSISAKLYLLRK